HSSLINHETSQYDGGRGDPNYFRDFAVSRRTLQDSFPSSCLDLVLDFRAWKSFIWARCASMRNSTAESRSSSKVERQGEGRLSSSVDNSRAVAFRIKNELRDTFEQAANVGFNHVRIGSGV